MKSISKSEALQDFDTIKLNGVFEVHLIHGNSNKLEIVGANKIVEKISYQVIDNSFTIENTYKGNWIHPGKNKIRLYITYDSLSRIYAYETCNIVTDNPLVGNDVGLVMASKLNEANLELNCNTFYFWNNFPCGGKVIISGQANQLKLWNFALMAIDASACQANNVLVENSSKGDCKISCTENFKYSIKGEGNIYLKGNPLNVEMIEETSTGKLIYE